MSQLATIEERIDAACKRCGRSSSEITLVGASKRQPAGALETAYNEGLRCFGENQVQEAAAKIPTLPADIDWHLIGPLQSNKAARAVELFSTVHSVDRLKIAKALARHAGAAQRTIRCFLQVNIGNESTKHGFSARDLGEGQMVDTLLELKNLELCGLMAIPPRASTAEASRPWFEKMRELSLALNQHHPIGQGLSMGMSDDFEVAIEEGATHVRLGSILFGERPS